MAVPPPEEPRSTEETPPDRISPGVATVIGATAGAAATQTPAALSTLTVGAGTVLSAKLAQETLEAILQSFDLFALRRKPIIAQEARGFLATFYPERTADEVQGLVAEEMKREAAFVAKQRERLARDLPKALSIPDLTKRMNRVLEILERERRYASMREDAMGARALGSAELANLRETSPRGAYWMLSGSVRQHTPFCLLMANKFWPHEVLDVVSSPVHAGCACYLVSEREAKSKGLMGDEHIPKPEEALRLARMFAERTGEIELAAYPEEIAAYLDELEEAPLVAVAGAAGVARARRYGTKPGERFAAGYQKGGQFRPRRGGVPGLRSLVRRALHDLLPERPQHPKLDKRGEWKWLESRKGERVQVFIPHARSFEREIDGTKFYSPPSSTEVYRDGVPEGMPSPASSEELRGLAQQVSEEKVASAAAVAATALDRLDTEHPPVEIGADGYATHEGLVRAGFNPASHEVRGDRTKIQYVNPKGATVAVVYGEDGRVAGTTWEPGVVQPEVATPLTRAPRTWDEFAQGVLAYTEALGQEEEADTARGMVVIDPDLEGGAATNHLGVIAFGPKSKIVIDDIADSHEHGQQVAWRARGEAWDTYRHAVHESAHSVNPQFYDYYGINKVLEEALTEELAGIETARLVRQSGQTDLLTWAHSNPLSTYVTGNYMDYRNRLAALLDAAKIAPEQREEFLRHLKFDLIAGERVESLVQAVQVAQPEQTRETVRDRVVGLLSQQDVADWTLLEKGPHTPILVSDLADVSRESYVHLGQPVEVGTRVQVRRWNHARGEHQDDWGEVSAILGQGQGTEPFLLSVMFEDGTSTSALLQKEIVAVEPRVREVEVSPGVHVREGDLVRFDNRLDGELSEGVVERVLMEGPGWQIDARTTEDSLNPGKLVRLNQAHSGGVERAEPMPEPPREREVEPHPLAMAAPPTTEPPIWQRPLDEYAPFPTAPDPKDPHALDPYYQRKHEWELEMKRALSLGLIEYEEARGRFGYWGDGRERRSSIMEGGRDIGGWQPLPSVLYHVTTAASRVRAEGLKTRDELAQERGLGLGGGEADTISFTTDAEIARDIERGLREMRQVALGEVTMPDLIERATKGDAGSKPFLREFIRQSYDGREWEPGEEYPQSVRDLLSGVVRGSLSRVMVDTEEGLLAQLQEVDPGNWRLEPGQESKIDAPKGKLYVGPQFIRDASPEEVREETIERVRSFMAWREQAGGPSDPVFFLADMQGLADVPESEIQTMTFEPTTRGQGYPLSGMKEWRTGSGQAVRLIEEPAPWSMAAPPTPTDAPHGKYQPLLDHLRIGMALRLANMDMSKLHYKGYEHFVLTHGLMFDRPHETDREFQATTAQECYTNALHAAATNPDLIYVEGYAYNGLLPIPHAWLVTAEGDLYDPTWSNMEGRDASQDVYIGVPFTTEFLVETVRRKGTDSLFDEWGEGVALEQPFPEENLEHPAGSPIPEELRAPDPDVLRALKPPDPYDTGMESPPTRDWDGFPFNARTGQAPNQYDTPPERTPEGHFVLYHGTSAERVGNIEQEGLKADDLGTVGVTTTPGGAQSFGAMAATRDKSEGVVLRLVLDQEWVSQQSITREVGGRGRNQFLFQAPDTDVRARRRFQGVPRSAIKDVSRYDFEAEERQMWSPPTVADPLEGLTVKLEDPYLTVDEPGGRRVGLLQIGRPEADGTHVDGIAVEESQRGQGIAEAMAREFHRATGRPLIHGGFTTPEGARFGFKMSSRYPAWNKVWLNVTDDGSLTYWQPGEPVIFTDDRDQIPQVSSSGRYPFESANDETFAPMKYGFYPRVQQAIDEGIAAGNATPAMASPPTAPPEREPVISVPADPEAVGLSFDKAETVDEFQRWRTKIEREHGVTVRGEVIAADDSRIPETLYHTTTNVPAVLADGTLHARGAGGLGGDKTDRIVSLTTSLPIAERITSDMRFVASLYERYGPAPPYDTDERADWGERVVEMLQEYGERDGFDWSPAYTREESDVQYKGYGLSDWFSGFLHERQSRAGIKNPIFFGLDESLTNVDPDNVGIVAVPKQNLDNGALVTDFDLHRGKGWGLDEIRVYGDVRIEAALPERMFSPSTHRVLSSDAEVSVAPTPEGVPPEVYRAWTLRKELFDAQMYRNALPDKHPERSVADHKVEQLSKVVAEAENAAGGRVFRLNESQLAEGERKMRDLGKRAAKLELEPPSLRKVAEEMVPVPPPPGWDPATSATGEWPGKGDLMKMTYVVAEGEEPKIEGWKFVATLQHLDGINVIRRVPGTEDDVDLADYRGGEALCDYCKTVRDRKDTFVVLNVGASEEQRGKAPDVPVGGTLQVGRNCLRDFFGHGSPDQIAGYLERWIELDSLEMEDDEEGGGGGRPRTYVPTDEYLTHVATMLRSDGWKPRSGFGRPTADAALDNRYYYQTEKRDKNNVPMWVEPTPEDAERAQAALKWVREEIGAKVDAGTASEFEHNMYAMARDDVMPERGMGILAYVPVAHSRELGREVERQERAKQDADSDWIGTEGARVEIEARVTFMEEKEGSYDTYYLTKLRDDDGNVITWFASRSIPIGDRVKATFTVKRHEEYQGVKQTTITRPSNLTHWNPEGPAPEAPPEKPTKKGQRVALTFGEEGEEQVTGEVEKAQRGFTVYVEGEEIGNETTWKRAQSSFEEYARNLGRRRERQAHLSQGLPEGAVVKMGSHNPLATGRYVTPTPSTHVQDGELVALRPKRQGDYVPDGGAWLPAHPPQDNADPELVWAAAKIEPWAGEQAGVRGYYVSAMGPDGIPVNIGERDVIVKPAPMGSPPTQRGASFRGDPVIHDWLAAALNGTVELHQVGEYDSGTPVIHVGDTLVSVVAAETPDAVEVSYLNVTPHGSGLGSRTVEELRRYAQGKGKSLRFSEVVNPEFFQRFDWLGARGDDTFVSLPGVPRIPYPADRGRWKNWDAELVQVEVLLPLRDALPTTRPEKVEKLREAIRLQGMIEPITVDHAVTDGRTYISEGNNRLEAAVAEGFTHVPVRVITVSKVNERHGGQIIPPVDAPQYTTPSAIGLPVLEPMASPATLPVPPTREVFEADPRTFWHGTQYGELLDEPPWTSGQGFHVGTYQAARDALRARSGWDLGPRGDLADRQQQARAGMRKWIGPETAHQDGSFTYTWQTNTPGLTSKVTLRFDGDTVEILKPERQPQERRPIPSVDAPASEWAAYHAVKPPRPEKPNYALEVAIREGANAWLQVRHGDEVLVEPHEGPTMWRSSGALAGEGSEAVPDPTKRPAIIPVWITGPMTGPPNDPRDDWWANGVMSANLKKGRARRGMYYRNISEDESSISAVLPDRSFVKTWEELQRPEAMASPATYRVEHTSPDPEGGAPMHDLADEVKGVFPEDIYSSQQEQFYGTGASEYDRESFAVVNRVRGRPDTEVTVYRGVPGEVDEINPGDWVTPSPGYAELNALQLSDDEDGHVISKEVRAGDLYNDGNSVNEWGWHPEPMASPRTATPEGFEVYTPPAATPVEDVPIAPRTNTGGESERETHARELYWKLAAMTPEEREAFGKAGGGSVPANAEPVPDLALQVARGEKPAVLILGGKTTRNKVLKAALDELGVKTREGEPVPEKEASTYAQAYARDHGLDFREDVEMESATLGQPDSVDMIDYAAYNPPDNAWRHVLVGVALGYSDADIARFVARRRTGNFGAAGQTEGEPPPLPSPESLVRQDAVALAHHLRQQPGQGTMRTRTTTPVEGQTGLRDALLIQARIAGFGTVEEYDAWTRDRLRALMTPESGARVAVRVESVSLPTLLEEGRVRNAHHGSVGVREKRHERSETYATSRAKLERAWFPIQQGEQENPDAYPIYGYLTTDREDLSAAASAFGDAKLTLKDVVRPRTTFIYSDSNYVAGRAPESVTPSPVDQPSEASVSYFQNMRGIEKLIYEQGDQPRSFPEFTVEEQQRIEAAGRAWGTSDPKEQEDMRNGARREIAESKGWRAWQHGDFFEAQIHGGVHIPEDVERIDFTGPADPEVKARLDQLGVPYVEHIEPMATVEPMASTATAEPPPSSYFASLLGSEQWNAHQQDLARQLREHGVGYTRAESPPSEDLAFAFEGLSIGSRWKAEHFDEVVGVLTDALERYPVLKNGRGDGAPFSEVVPMSADSPLSNSLRDRMRLNSSLMGMARSPRWPDAKLLLNDLAVWDMGSEQDSVKLSQAAASGYEGATWHEVGHLLASAADIDPGGPDIEARGRAILDHLAQYGITEEDIASISPYAQVGGGVESISELSAEYHMGHLSGPLLDDAERLFGDLR